MRSDFNVGDFGGDAAGASGGGGMPTGNFPLTNQASTSKSIYSLTLDELQNTLGVSIIGSMNMDEFLQKLQTFEANQTMSGVFDTRRQRSVTLPQSAIDKTVNEIWQQMSQQFFDGDIGDFGVSVRRQSTLGETTLEDLLVGAGAVMEYVNTSANLVSNAGVNGNGGDYGDLMLGDDIAGLGNGGLMSDINQLTSMQSVNSLLDDMNSAGSSHQRSSLPKPPGLSCANQQLLSEGVVIEYVNTSANLVSNAGVNGDGVDYGDLMLGDDNAGVGNGGLMSDINQLTSMQSVNSSLDDMNAAGSSHSHRPLLPKPPGFSCANQQLSRDKKRGVIGRMDKAAESKQRKMMQNRECAARIRAHKKEYDKKLEARIAELEKEALELRKHGDMMRGAKRFRLRRTQTCPW